MAKRFLGDERIKFSTRQGTGERVGTVKRDLLFESDHLGQPDSTVHATLVQVDASDPAAIMVGKVTRRAAQSAAYVEDVS